MSLRDEQVELTRRAIIEAVVELSATPDGGRITVAEVARRSGISPATIYRHFPDRDALVGGAALHGIARWEAARAASVNDGARAAHDPSHEHVGDPDDRAGSDAGPDGTGLSDPDEEYLRALWSDLEANIELARQGTVTEAGRELRAKRFEVVRSAMDRVLREAGHDPAAPETRHLLACLDVLSSAYAFLDLHDRQGLSADEAVDAVAWGFRTLIAAVGLDPALLTFSDRLHLLREGPT